MITVLSTEQMKKSDAYTVKNITCERELIENAAAALFDSVKERNGPFCIACGGGNNGADGLALAKLIFKSEKEVCVCLLSKKLSDEGERFYNECKALGIDMFFADDNTEFSKYDTIVDCIIGTGFKGELRENTAKVIEKINNSGAYVVSADINSGLDTDNGTGDLCVISDLTVALGEYKYGHFLARAKDVMKSKKRYDVGIKVTQQDSYLIEKDDIAPLFANRKNDTHKGVYGYVTVIGGSVEYSGAAKLANMAMCALRSGCGVCRLAVPSNISHAVMPYLLESTLCPMKSDENGIVFDKETADKALDKASCVSIGMGMKMGKEQEKLLSYILQNYKGRLIIDADGINTLARLEGDDLKRTESTVILTPHIKEFSRLCGKSCDEILNSPICIAKKYAKENGIILLLKGTSTLVTDGDTVYITDKGAPGMATAGSGDVLSGILTGIMGHVSDDSVLLATAAGAYINGVCGMMAQEEFTACAMTSSDTAKFIPKVMKKLLN